MQTYRLALIGFGNVGQGFTQILRDFGKEYENQFGAKFVITAVSDTIKGSLYNPDGLDPEALLSAVQTSGRIDSVPAVFKGWDAFKTIQESNADVIADMSLPPIRVR
jgi:homoserine dehydrogenase